MFGHVLIIAGSDRMLGAGILTTLSAMRSGAGLVTLCIPESLNSIAQKKIPNVVMTLPLKETKKKSLSLSSLKEILDFSKKCSVIAIGPGLVLNKNTELLIKRLIIESKIPLVVDASGINAIAKDPQILLSSSTSIILTPHPGEMHNLSKIKKEVIEKNRRQVAEYFANRFNCVLLLKGFKTVVAAKGHKTYINNSGNAGMATAGSGDVLTGMIASFAGQGLSAFDAAKYGAYYHGKAGDLAVKKYGGVSLIASDIIEYIPKVLKRDAK